MPKIFAFAFAATIAAAGASAQTATDVQARKDNSAYAQDSRGNVVRNGFGLCWRSGYWTGNDAVLGCDGQLESPLAKATAPSVPSATTPVAPPPVAAAVAPKRCDFSANLGGDQAFAFNAARLTNVAKRHIDDAVMARLVNCAKVEVIVATGHSDRLGTQKYNLRLSEKRAAAVASYLKSKGVTAPIEAIGAGESVPVKACNNRLARPKLIACLAPNRRVGIEVRGTAK
jgi:OOP family OmpA-OmpF porin